MYGAVETASVNNAILYSSLFLAYFVHQYTIFAAIVWIEVYNAQLLVSILLFVLCLFAKLMLHRLPVSSS